MKHKHEILEITTLYKQDKPAKIELVKCRYCDTAFPELIAMLQEREDETFKALGGKSPVIFLQPNMEWAEQKTLVHKAELADTKQ